MRDLSFVRFTQHHLWLSNPCRIALGDLKNWSILNRHPTPATHRITPPPNGAVHTTASRTAFVFGAIVPGTVWISYSEHMDHLGVFRDKIGRLRLEIADIQELNQQFWRDGGNGTGDQVAHGQRSERLQEIQHELMQLADLGRGVVSTEQLREKHRSRLHLAKQKRAA
jgi:hypothetical protein